MKARSRIASKGPSPTSRNRTFSTAAKRPGKRLEQQRVTLFGRHPGDAKKHERAVSLRRRHRGSRAAEPFTTNTFTKKSLAEDIGQIAPLRSGVVALKQTRKMGTDGDAPARPLGDPADQVALPPPPAGGAGAMLGDNKRDPKAPVDRQRQYPGIQAAMRVNQIRPTILANVTAEKFHAASGPRQRIAVRQPRQRGKVVAPVDRHAVIFDGSGVSSPARRTRPACQIAPGVNGGSEYRDAMTRRL